MTVFYSWQSDLPTDTNNRVIAICLKKAIAKLDEGNVDYNILFDEATRGEIGSPEIPATILNKIAKADIFIADVTVINNNDHSKKTPNPNVLIELGFAISELGWERIIMLYNKNYGNFPNDLPFDLDKRRVTTFKITGKDDMNGKGTLTSILQDALSGIIKANPAKQSLLKPKNIEFIKREKDIKNIMTLLETINISTLELFLEHLPNKILEPIFYFRDSFKSVFESTSFYIYDKEIKKYFTDFNLLWEKYLNYGDHFSSKGTGDELLLPHELR